MTALVLSIFSLGFISAYLVVLLENNVETPFSFSKSEQDITPSNVINEKDIKVYNDRVVIYIDGAKISRYAPTGSMRPTFDEYSNGIKITPESENDINVGDIITYRDGEDLIVHRVVEKGEDQEGTYFITKGDNNAIVDGKIRFSMIDSKTIAILY
jgi:signal peptidase I